MTKSTFCVHLTTDAVTAELEVQFHPADGNTNPLSPSEWPDTRETLRQKVEDSLDGPTAWKAFLDAGRPGRRLDAAIGEITVDDSGAILDIDLTAESPADVGGPPT